MTTMISEVYSAFKTAGAPEQEARQAAEALSAENLATRSVLAEDKRDLSDHIAGAEQRMSDKIDAVRDKIDAVDQKLSGEIAAVRKEITAVDRKLSDRIPAVEQKLSDRIAAVEQKLSDRIAAVEQKLSDRITGVKEHVSNEIGEVRRIMSVIRWMLGLVIVVVALPILREIIVAWS